MKVPFFGPSYQARAVPMDVQTCINLYYEGNEGGQGEEGAFIGTPGTSIACAANTTFFQGPTRGILAANNLLYTVSGAYVGSIDYDKATATYTTNIPVGTIPDGTDPVSMADNGLQLAVAHSGGISVYTYATGAFTLVADSPVNSVIGYIDSYILAISTKGTFFWSNIANASVFDGLSFASAEGSPDGLVSLIVDHREVWLFGERTTEVWGSSGDPEQPFTRTGNAFLEHGCAAKFSPAKINNTVIWLGADANGDSIVFLAAGYAPQRISTHALEYEFSTYSTIADAIGMTYQIEGHSFYVLTFPTADKTWQYDFSTSLWSRLAYKKVKQGTLHRHAMSCIAFFKGKHLIGQWNKGIILDYSHAYKTDYLLHGYDGVSWTVGTNQVSIYRERSFMVPDNENRRTRHNYLELKAEFGVGLDGSYDGDGLYGINGQRPTVWLDRSLDYGRTWVNCGTRELGGVGEYQRRAIWRRLGIHRHAAYRVCMTDPVKCVWMNVTGEGG